MIQGMVQAAQSWVNDCRSVRAQKNTRNRPAAGELNFTFLAEPVLRIAPTKAALTPWKDADPDVPKNEAQITMGRNHQSGSAGADCVGRSFHWTSHSKIWRPKLILEVINWHFTVGQKISCV
jgi:hypothetical protein